MITNHRTTYPDSKHTFYTNLFAFKMVLDDVDFFANNGNLKDKGLSLVCDNCKSNFIFTSELVGMLESPCLFQSK